MSCANGGTCVQREVGRLVLDVSCKNERIKALEARIAVLTQSDQDKAEYIRVLTHQHEVQSKMLVDSGRKETAALVAARQRDWDRQVPACVCVCVRV